MALNHLGAPMKFSDPAGDPLPATGALGLGYTLIWSPSFTSLISIEGGWSWDNTILLKFGMESWVASILALRAGYQPDAASGSLSAGFGLSLPYLILDYGAWFHGRLGTTHRASLVFRWTAEPDLPLGATTVIQPSAKSLPEWVWNAPPFAVTEEGLVVKMSVFRAPSTEEALASAKREAKSALQQTLASKVVNDLIAMSRDWSGPQELRQRFIQDLSASLSAHLKDFVRGASTRGSYVEQVEETVEPGETDMFANAYVLMELPLSEYRQTRKALIRQHRAGLPEFADAGEKQLVEESYDRILKRLDLKAGEFIVLERAQTYQPEWAAFEGSLAVQERFNQTAWTFRTYLPSLTTAPAFTQTTMVPEVAQHLLNRFRDQWKPLLQRLTEFPTEQRAVAEAIGPAFKTAAEEVLRQLDPDRYHELVQRAVNGDGLMEETYAVWLKFTVTSEQYAEIRRNAFQRAQRAAQEGKNESLQRLLSQLETLLSTP